MAETPLNLKLLLIEFGNRLVTDLGYEQSGAMPEDLKQELKGDHSTEPITVFTLWLNEHPEARKVLKDMGIDWPM